MCPTIDTKVCNKKVAVDDSYKWKGRGDTTDIRGGEVTDARWSCVDYVDAPGEREGSGEQKFGKRPEGRALSARFGGIEYADRLREDGKGECKGYKEDADGAAGQIQPCGSIKTLDLLGGGEAKVHKWWTGKRTNAGWPGTAEGKINTAQGMAGDLVSKLDSEEKSAVAGIWGSE